MASVTIPGSVPTAVDTSADLRVTAGRIGDVRVTSGYATPGDGGGGTWIYDDARAAEDDDGTVVNGWVRLFDGPVNVTWFGATGTYATDWNTIPAANSDAIEAAMAVAVAKKRPLYFPMTAGGGIYVHARAIEITSQFFEAFGDKGTETVFVGVGAAWKVDGGVSGLVQGAGLLFGVRMRDLIIRGNASTGVTVGLYLRSVHQGVFEDVRVESCTDAALMMLSCSSNRITNFVCSVNQRDFLPKPTFGIVLDKRPADAVGWTCVMNVFINAIIEGLPAGRGIDIVDGAMNSFLAGTSEGNARGVRIAAASYSNEFRGFTMVQNVTGDLEVAGSYNVFENCQGQASIVFQSGSGGNVLRSGTYTGSVTNESTREQWYDRPTFSSAVVLTDVVTAGAERRYWRTVPGAWSSV